MAPSVSKDENKKCPKCTGIYYIGWNHVVVSVNLVATTGII